NVTLIGKSNESTSEKNLKQTHTISGGHKLKKINLLVALGICSMTLVACSGSKSEPSPNDHSVVQSEESVEKETTSVEEEGLDTLDPETKKELEKLNDEEEEIDWDKVHLT